MTGWYKRTMLRLTSAGLLCACVMLWGLAVKADAMRFLSVIDDLPLMAGLIEDADAALIFDGPAGRIVEAYANGPVKAGAVSGFYAATLPQLGWQPAADGRYQRDRETLKLEISSDPDGRSGIRVQFLLKPLDQ